jgi:NADH-quinone oxidoreductase subunit L
MQTIASIIILSPLIGAILAYACGKRLNRDWAHYMAIGGVGLSTILSAYVLYLLVWADAPSLNVNVYTWGSVGTLSFHIGFLIDKLTAMMMLVVTFVSLMVHIYTIGYMHDDDGYQRFFSYIAFFTFAMLSLVMSNNFLQLFFGWEAVGVASYLLIGFWYQRPTAVFANMKAFLVNRVGDLGFLLGIGLVYWAFGSLDYAEVFAQIPVFATQFAQIDLMGNIHISVITLICLFLFIGAMGKSAQIPLHVWLPDSMEGPTPISALIHAATMVTAGVFMIARMSPLFEYSEVALSTILIIGALTALFMGLLGLVQNDIKRVIAYSTLSQLGYMMVALGASGYAEGLFHLMTHAFFKALLFLGAGSVIIALHHEQDMRNMGGLRKHMPITYWTMLIGSLALCGIPPFAGFYSKELIIEAVKLSTLPGASFAYWATIISVFVTALYSFRLFFMVFHTQERMDAQTRSHLHESPPVVWWPLVILAIPSVVIGGLCVETFLFESPGYFHNAITVLPYHDPNIYLAEHFPGVLGSILHAPFTLPFWLAIAGIVAAWLMYERYPHVPKWFQEKFSLVYYVMINKYGFDAFNQWFFVDGARKLGSVLWHTGDITIIDNGIVNGSANSVGYLSRILRHWQSGYLYHYAFAMIVGLLALLTWLVWW